MVQMSFCNRNFFSGLHVLVLFMSVVMTKHFGYSKVLLFVLHVFDTSSSDVWTFVDRDSCGYRHISLILFKNLIYSKWQWGRIARTVLDWPIDISKERVAYFCRCGFHNCDILQPDIWWFESSFFQNLIYIKRYFTLLLTLLLPHMILTLKSIGKLADFPDFLYNLAYHECDPFTIIWDNVLK